MQNNVFIKRFNFKCVVWEERLDTVTPPM